MGYGVAATLIRKKNNNNITNIPATVNPRNSNARHRHLVLKMLVQRTLYGKLGRNLPPGSLDTL